MKSDGRVFSWAAEGELACKTVGLFHNFGCNLSSFMVVALVLERYWQITWPHKAFMAYLRAKDMALGAWIASGIVSLPEVVKVVKSNVEYEV